jgi:hypothetical protein
MKFNFFHEGIFKIFVLDKVEQEILALKDVRIKKKIIQNLNRLSQRIPNSPEMWKVLKNCEEVTVYELKPKPYRLGCYKYKNNILVLHMWRVQKGMDLQKRKEITKACNIAREIKDEFERFIGGI